MYHVIPIEQGAQDLFFKRVKTEFSGKQNQEYVPLPIKQSV